MLASLAETGLELDGPAGAACSTWPLHFALCRVAQWREGLSCIVEEISLMGSQLSSASSLIRNMLCSSTGCENCHEENLAKKEPVLRDGGVPPYVDTEENL